MTTSQAISLVLAGDNFPALATSAAIKGRTCLHGNFIFVINCCSSSRLSDATVLDFVSNLLATKRLKIPAARKLPMCVACRNTLCQGECRGCVAALTMDTKTYNHYPRSHPTVSNDDRFTRHRDSMASLNIPNSATKSPLRPSLSSSSLSTTSSSSSSFANQVRCISPASISSLSSLGSSTCSSSVSSIDDLDEPFASRSGRSGLARRIRQGYGIRPKTSRKQRRVCFHPSVLLWTAVQQGDFDELLAILSHTPAPVSSDDRVHDRLAVNTANHQGITPLHLCCFAGADECVRLLLVHGAIADCWDDDGWTPLHAACVGGHHTTINFLVRAGADIRRADHYGRTALDVASSNATKLLLQRLVVERDFRTSQHSSQPARQCTEV